MTEELILPEGTFTGLQVVDPTNTDWKEGQETGIAGVTQNASADWRTHLPVPKTQLILVNGSKYGDTESCTNFSATNDLATYLQFLIDTNQMPAPQLSFLQNNGYIVAGKIDLSPRFSAITSGTTGQKGNNLPNVWQTLRTVGIVPDADCPTPISEWAAKIASGSYTVQDLWAIWFDPNAITPAAKAKAKEFLTFFGIQYQWVSYPGAEGTPTTLHQSLMTAPIQIVTAVCAGWNTDDPIQGCGAGSAHATELTCVTTDSYDIFDHYVPYQKQFSLNYIITYGMQGIAVPLTQSAPVTYPPPSPFHYTFTQQLDLNATGPEVVALQDALKTNGDFPLSVKSTGFFGTVTETAVKAFQAKYGIPTVGRVGPITIAKLNSLT